MATLRNTAIGWHRINGETNIARANRRADRRSDDLVRAVTSSYPNTQRPCLPTLAEKTQPGVPCPSGQVRTANQPISTGLEPAVLQEE